MYTFIAKKYLKQTFRKKNIPLLYIVGKIMRANIHKKQFLKVTHYSHPTKSVFNLQLPYLQKHTSIVTLWRPTVTFSSLLQTCG